MKKKIGVTGCYGKLGSLLLEKPNFVALDCDVTNLESIEMGKQVGIDLWGGFDLIVNCAAISGIEDCAKDYDKAIRVNVRGLSNLHKVFGERVLNISSDQVYRVNLGGSQVKIPRPLPPIIMAGQRLVQRQFQL